MAVGDAVLLHSSVANDAYLTIQPASGDEYIINSIWAAGAIEIYMTDGTNNVLVENTAVEPYSFNGCKWIASNTYYLKVKNVSGGSIYIGCSGLVIKD
jgi:hypothetical protein